VVGALSIYLDLRDSSFHPDNYPRMEQLMGRATGFAESRRIALGDLAQVAKAVKAAVDWERRFNRENCPIDFDIPCRSPRASCCS